MQQNEESHEAIARAGSPAALVELTRSGIPDAKRYALWALSLSITAANQSIVVEAGGVPALVDAATEPDADTTTLERAAAAIYKLADGNVETRSAIHKVDQRSTLC